MFTTKFNGTEFIFEHSILSPYEMSSATQNPFQHTVHRASLLPLTPIYFDFALFIVVLPVLCVGADSRFGDSFRGRSCLLPGLQCYSVGGQCGERTSFNQVLYAADQTNPILGGRP